MRRSRHRKIALLFASLFLALAAVPVWLTWLQIRQERLNQALIAAVKRIDAPAVISLLKQGADVNTSDQLHENLSLWQRMLQSLRIRRRRSSSEAPTPLQLALNNVEFTNMIGTVSETDILKALVYHGADVNVQDEYGNPALCRVAGMGDASLIQVLLSHRAKVNARTRIGETPLMCASTAAIIRVLLAHGANVNARSNSGDTALTEVLDDASAQALLDAGADIFASNHAGWTALHSAARTGRPAVVKVLLAHGAAINARNDDGQTALWCAEEDRGEECIRLLKAAGAKE